MTWTGFGWAAVGGERAQRFRIWSVTAIDADGRPGDAGIVMASDPDVAADQMCGYLDGARIATGQWYLVATRDPVDLRLGTPRSPVRMFAPLYGDSAGGVVTRGDWVLVDGRETAPWQAW